jgi:acetyl esterase/lipase
VGDPSLDRVVIYLHGGGYRCGEAVAWVPYAAGLAAAANVRVVIPDYRLAPEFPFPAAIEDSAAVYQVIAEETRTGSFIVMGESAGGHLTPATILAAIANNARLPNAAIMISPWIDLSNTSPVIRSHAHLDKRVSQESLNTMRGLFVQGDTSVDHPLVSPLNGDVSRFPPSQIYCGGSEVLLGDAMAFTAKLAQANRHVEAYFLPEMEHGWSFINPEFPLSKFTLDKIVAFIKAHS